MASRDYADIDRPEIATRPQEQLLIESIERYAPDRILCTSQGLAQLGIAAAVQFPEAAVYCHFFDLYRAEKARVYAANRSTLSIGCSADFPSEEFDLAALPFSAQGEAELTRDLLQAAHQRLKMGGHLLVSSDNPRDRWLHDEMRKVFTTVSRRESASGAVYAAQKNTPLKKVRDYRAEFAFRDRGRLIHALSRPGVFSHREIDPGARQLLNAMEVGPGDRVLDIGCGSGVVSLAAAFRAEGVNVLAVDSHARAVECTAQGATQNGLTKIDVELSATGPSQGLGAFDLVVANPPYYAGFRIARFFVETGRAALRPGGSIVAVTKRPDWYHEQMPQWFSNVQIAPSKQFWIVRARAKG